MNLAAIVRRAALHDPLATAIRFEGRTITHGELDRLVARAANVLAALGVRPGDRVALVLPNVPDFVVAYLGTLRLGAIAASVSATWPGEAMERALAAAAPRVVVTTRELRARLTGDAGGTVLVVDDDALAAGSWRGRLGQARDEAPIVPRHADHPAAILFSSGTTGDPKGVTLSHGNVRFNAIAKRRSLGIGPGARLLLFVPVTHVYGQNAVLTSALCAGASVVLQRRFDEADALAAIAHEGVTMLPAVPAALARLLAAAPPAVLRQLQLAFSAAAPLPSATAHAWREATGRAIQVGYGLTETSPFATHARGDAGPGSVGRAIDGVEVRAADPESGRLLPAGSTGELVIRGPNVMLGYWQRPRETAAALRDGWLRTGDLGAVEADGTTRLLDRLADVVNVSGFKVVPLDVEEALRRHPAVADAAAFAVPDARTGERVEAAVELRDGATLSEAELLATCRAALPAYAVPRRVVARALPRNPGGKTLRRVLRDEARQAPAVTTPPAPGGPLPFRRETAWQT